MKLTFVFVIMAGLVAVTLSQSVHDELYQVGADGLVQVDHQFSDDHIIEKRAGKYRGGYGGGGHHGGGHYGGGGGHYGGGHGGGHHGGHGGGHHGGHHGHYHG